MFKKRVGLFLIPLLLIAGLAFGYTRSWDETDPIDHSKNSTWPAEIREVMVDVAERLDDIMNGFGSSDTVTDFNLVPINNRAADPSAVADTGIIYTKDVDSKAELFWIDEDGDTKQLTSGGEFIGGFTGEIRMWYGAIADIPAGWELADGSCTNSCPDLTNKFIVGADADDGGVAKSTITGSALASYTQTAATADSHTLTTRERQPEKDGILRLHTGYSNRTS